ncbi:hypothetical protein PAXRUDRAFT_453458 [Paxillus rubicundulus Ve08.2h10]|uniref:Unplaced genomic scaffold scaffold_29, whole genome shotgun sequence n=1 Tax=Paxillus rubicundulus Ve08.2h10 TaxID=930991 RepID=A0A0D0DM34_9AGAM|nr:hypothetical protein PAXRUDRAFT_453458 [Paxillus rubicundulus Ve08.2h10]
MSPRSCESVSMIDTDVGTSTFRLHRVHLPHMLRPSQSRGSSANLGAPFVSVSRHKFRSMKLQYTLLPEIGGGPRAHAAATTLKLYLHSIVLEALLARRSPHPCWTPLLFVSLHDTIDFAVEKVAMITSTYVVRVI